VRENISGSARGSQRKTPAVARLKEERVYFFQRGAVKRGKAGR